MYLCVCVCVCVDTLIMLRYLDELHCTMTESCISAVSVPDIVFIYAIITICSLLSVSSSFIPFH